jgi:hypothetical protein
MTLIRLILFVLVGYMARRLYLGVKSVARSGERKPSAAPGPPSKAEVKDLTDQDIDDAEFEEIP